MIFSNRNYYKKKFISDLLGSAEEVGPKLFSKSVKPVIKEVALFGSSSQVGLCVLQHLIALGIKTLVVYHNNRIDFTHPLLTFCHTSDLEKHKDQLQNIIFIASINHLFSYRRFFTNTKKIVCFSSTSAVTKAKSNNIFEQEIVRSLLDGEQNVKIMAEECKFDFVILRPTLIYGLGIDSNVTAIKRFIQKFKFFLLYPPANGKRQPVHADDLAMAAISCLDNPKIKNKIYDLPGGETLTYL
jgi:nucleoside-diphosphate-sugar epimerase